MPMPEKTVGNNMLKQLQWGMHDAIIDGEIVHDIPSKVVYVSSQSELSNFADALPGTIAIQYGLVNIWQLKPNGSWAAL